MSARLVRLIDRLRERPHWLRAVFFGLLGLFLVYDVFAPRHGAHFWGDRVRGFWAGFALVGGLVMAKGMKGLGHLWLMKPVDYYDREED